MHKQIPIHYQEVSLSELSADDHALIIHAMEATRGAYCPYSRFCVGAALRLSDGTIVTGANQENVAYPSGLCAERTAMFAASAQYPMLAFDTLAVVGQHAESTRFAPASPCGACRQVMAEYEQRWNRKLRVLSYVSNEKILIFEGTENLLPFVFTL